MRSALPTRHVWNEPSARDTDANMKRVGIVAALTLFLYCPKGRLEAAENLRAASGGFTTAIHAVLWAANEEKIFRKYGLNVEYLALNTGRLGMQKFYRF
jgi:ABC-type nitrate/sulfonate/bicarbonate transport system substrate-binding protein